jgi:DNA-binding IclR family transcriptional regulator
MVERTITTHLPMRCFHECSVKKGCYRFPRHPQRPGRRVLASDPMARSAEEWEYVIGEGPAHDTRTEGPLQADVAQISERFPSYGPAVRELGVASVAAVPLRTRRSQVGSLVVLGADIDATATIWRG